MDYCKASFDRKNSKFGCWADETGGLFFQLEILVESAMKNMHEPNSILSERNSTFKAFGIPLQKNTDLGWKIMNFGAIYLYEFSISTCACNKLLKYWGLEVGLLREHIFLILKRQKADNVFFFL